MKTFQIYATVVMVLVFLSMLLASHKAAAEKTSAPDISPADKTLGDLGQLLRKQGVRGITCSKLTKKEISALTERAADAGFNIILPWNPGYSLLKNAKKTTNPDSPVILNPEDIPQESLAPLRDWAINCKKDNMLLMYVLYSAAASEVRYLTGLEANPTGGHIYKYVQFEDRDLRKSRVKKLWAAHNYRHAVTNDGGRKMWAPCPLERRYWMGLVRPELETVAKVLKETGAGGGATLELEAYCFYSIYPGYASQKTSFCYCDECFYGFARAHEKNDVVDAVPPQKRLDWLTLRGLLPAYERSLEDRLTLIVREMMQNVRKINPQFLLGIYPYAPHWYYDALIRGSGTPDQPTLLFSSAEYDSGYRTKNDPPFTFSSEVPTAGGIAHLQNRKFHALYAGGLYDRKYKSSEAYAVAADRLLRSANGYWVYRENKTSQFEPSWKHFLEINKWNSAHPDPLPTGTLQDVLPGALKDIREQKQPGLTVEQGHVVASYQGDDKDTPATAQPFDDKQQLELEQEGRDAQLPSLDKKIVHSGEVSLRFEAVPGTSPKQPYIDYFVKGKKAKLCELTFWVKTESTAPMRLYVGTAMNTQYPVYMWYHNYVMSPKKDWTRIRIVPVMSKNMKRLDVLRFWCQDISGKLWIDDIQTNPVAERVIDVPLELAKNASGWGKLTWRLSPTDAVAHGELISSDDNSVIQKRIYSGDSLAPLMAIVGRKPILLRLRVYPSAKANVVLEQVELGSVQNK